MGGGWMDWYLSGDDPAGVGALRHQIRNYLTRHGEPGAEVGDAELVVQELLANAVEHATGPVWCACPGRGSSPTSRCGTSVPPAGAATPPVPVERLEAS